MNKAMELAQKVIKEYEKSLEKEAKEAAKRIPALLDAAEDAAVAFASSYRMSDCPLPRNYLFQVDHSDFGDVAKYVDRRGISREWQDMANVRSMAIMYNQPHRTTTVAVKLLP